MIANTSTNPVIPLTKLSAAVLETMFPASRCSSIEAQSGSSGNISEANEPPMFAFESQAVPLQLPTRASSKLVRMKNIIVGTCAVLMLTIDCVCSSVSGILTDATRRHSATTDHIDRE